MIDSHEVKYPKTDYHLSSLEAPDPILSSGKSNQLSFNQQGTKCYVLNVILNCHILCLEGPMMLKFGLLIGLGIPMLCVKFEPNLFLT